jgi:hypothetical protein
LEVLLAVESDGLGLDFSLLDIHLIATENDRDVLANSDKITWSIKVSCPHDSFFRWQIHTVPVRDVLVCDAGGHIEHDDTTLAIDVVAITETAKLLLPSSVPHVELNLAEVLVEMLVCRGMLPRLYRVLTVVKPRGWTSTPRVAMYFFSNSPVKWRLTKVVY